MKRIFKFAFFIPLASISLMVSCGSDDDSVTDDFMDVNGSVPVRLIESITTQSAQSSEENIALQATYDGDDRLTTVSNGEETSFFVYENDELATVTGEGDPLNTSELYQSPYDAFEVGEILEYDSNGNPSRILFLEEDFEGEIEEFTATLSYDNTPNPFFYTMRAGRIIEVLDNVELEFSMAPQPSEIVLARMLFPVNNLSGMVIRNESNEIVYQLNADFVYDADDYPTSGTFTAISDEDGTSVYTAAFTYKQ